MGRRVKVPAGGPREAALFHALRLGNTRRAAAAAVDITSPTFYRMMEDVAFRSAVEKAEAEAELAHVSTIAQAASEGVWQASAWWLERRKHEDYARRDKSEMTIDVRREAERIAAANGLNADELMAEAERILASAR